jgi:hypothetical protein
MEYRARRFTQSTKWSDGIDASKQNTLMTKANPCGIAGAERMYPCRLGSFWGRPVGSDQRPAPLLMEALTTRLLQLDVRFYGSMPLAKFWPEEVTNRTSTVADTCHRI